MLLVGPWRTGTSDYTCMFGDIPVRAGLVQEGVLSCITPGEISSYKTKYNMVNGKASIHQIQ